MPCYEPPRPDVHDFNEMAKQRDKYVATLKDIEESCKQTFSSTAMPPWAHESKALAQQILDIIHSYWGKT